MRSWKPVSAGNGCGRAGEVIVAEYQKAYICSYEGNRPNLATRFYVQFNPAELSVEEAIGMTDEEDGGNTLERLLREGGIGWQRPTDSTASRKQKNRLTLSATLFFNTLTDLCQNPAEDVRKYIRQLYPYTNKAIEDKQAMKQIYFFWGSIAVAGILTRLHVQYTMFAPDGRPVRAQAEISIAGDYVGDASVSSAETKASGEATGLAGGDTIKMLADGTHWRLQVKVKGNPRLL